MVEVKTVAADPAAHAADDEHALPAAGASSDEVVEEEEAKKKNSILEESSFERARALQCPLRSGPGSTTRALHLLLGCTKENICTY